MYSQAIQKLIDLFAKFPGVGPKTAARFVFYLLKNGDHEAQELSQTIANLKKSLKLCNFCFKWFTGQDNICEICSNGARNKNLLCIVEKQTDLVSIEKNKIYKGLYFILGGTINNLQEQEINKLRINQLIQRIKNPEKFGISGADFQEIIIATNPTIEGEATTLFLERKLKKNLPALPGRQAGGRQVTRLARGLPTGGELEYADKETLKSAFERRF